MDIKEFIDFTKEIRLNIGMMSIEELYKKIDSDGSGKIDFNEFLTYLEELTSAKEFEEDFNKFAGKKGYMDVNDMIKYMKEIQRESEFSLYDAIHIILFYNKEINEDLLKTLGEKLEKYQISFKFRLKDHLKADLSDWQEREIFYFKFKLSMLQNYLINPLHNNINGIIENNMDYPVNDYFVYSSHNTYLKGHQLYGKINH